VLRREWRVSGAQNGVVVQRVTQTVTSERGTSRPFTFYEAWELAGGLWSPDTGRIDNFIPHAEVTALTVTATAYFYPGASLPASMQPGGVRQAGHLPSSRSEPQISGPRRGPIEITYVCKPKSK
jgi:hypothetical protein